MWIDKAETTLKSIYANNQDVKTYILNPDIPHEWFININRRLKPLNSKIVDIKIDLSRFDDMPDPKDRISKTVYGKFLIPELINEDKVLYLDSDVIVDENLDVLFKTDIEDRPLYTVVDYFNPQEFNSGVLLINNTFWHNNNIGNQFLDLIRKSNMCNTQKMMNEGFAQNYGKLDPKYNYQIGNGLKAYWANIESFYAFCEKVKTPAIIHYCEKDKPFKVTTRTELRQKWWDYHNLDWSEVTSRDCKFSGQEVPHFDAEAYIFTYLAEIQNLEELAKKLPNVHFNVGAYTPVSFSLSRLCQYDNVTVYPTVTARKRLELINACDVYLDINYGRKEREVMKRITSRNVPILSFISTKTDNINYDNYHIFGDDQIDGMTNYIKKIVETPSKKPSSKLFDIHVISMDESLDRIINDKKSIIRFGDGELYLINKKGIYYQTYDENLSKHLKRILLKGSNSKYDVGVPDVFENLEKYSQYARNFYENAFSFKFMKILKEVEQTHNTYSNAFISRPYMDLIDKTKSVKYFDKLKQIWKDKDILIVEGSLTRSGVGNDLFDGAKSIKRIIVPAQNAYEKVDLIEKMILENVEDRLVLLMLGPTAKVVVDDLQDLDNQLIDIGHVDCEYEWFKMGALYKVKLSDKHTAEFNSSGVTVEIHDQAYEDEIIGRVE